MLTIEVTQADIDKGCKGDAQACAIAQALLRMGHDRVEVNGDYINTDQGNWTCSDAMCEFITDFDNDGPAGVSPTTFNVADYAPSDEGDEDCGFGY